jgi:hypothetical protein
MHHHINCKNISYRTVREEKEKKARNIKIQKGKALSKLTLKERKLLGL